MRSTDWGALIVLVVVVALLVLAGLSFNKSDLTPFTMCLATLLAWVIYVGLTSFYRITPDRMLASVFIGTMKETYVNGQFAKVKKEIDGDEISIAELEGKRGLFGWDIVILLYPLWYGVYFPTTVVKLIIHATTVYLKEYKEGDDIKSPGVPVRVDTTILFRLTPILDEFVQAINVLSRGVYDLAHETEIRDNLWETGDEKNSRYVYSSPRIAQLVLDTVSETVLHAVRSVASQYYTWKEVSPEKTGEDIRDIKGSIPYFRDNVLQNLAERQSVFCQAGMLKPLEPVSTNRRDGRRVALGPAVLSFDLRVEDVTPEEERFRQALHEPMIADLQADADRLRGVGEGERLKEKAARSGVSPDVIIQSETLQGVKEVKVIGAGDTITDLVKRFLGGGK